MVNCVKSRNQQVDVEMDPQMKVMNEKIEGHTLRFQCIGHLIQILIRGPLNNIDDF